MCVRILCLAAVVVLGLLIWLTATNVRAAALRSDGPGDLTQFKTIRARITEAGDSKVVHIIFVHGMRAEGRGASDIFRKQLALSFPELVADPLMDNGRPTDQPTGLDIGPPPPATVMGLDFWRTEADWKASRPFVDRYVFRRGGKPAVIVDEVNWWPLLFPLKCRVLLATEGRLAGADRAHLELCAGDKKHQHPDYDYHPWLSPEDLQAALRTPYSGGGVAINRAIKQQLLDWGLSDAVIALGPMRLYIRRAIAAAIAGAGDRPPKDQQLILISESLGSFAVMDALQYADHGPPDPALEEKVAAFSRVMHQTQDLYFFANQFPLLELGRLEGIPPSPGFLSQARDAGTDEDRRRSDARRGFAALSAWTQPGPTPGSTHDPKLNPSAEVDRQIVSFSDPSDLLTFYVPDLPPVKVANIYDRNEWSFFGLFANPVSAHTGHSSNKAVLRALFGKDWSSVKRD